MSSYLPSEFGTFAQVNQDFKRLMVTVKDNDNVLQCCQRESGSRFIALDSVDHADDGLETDGVNFRGVGFDSRNPHKVD